MADVGERWHPATYQDVPGWAVDDLADAWNAFRASLAFLPDTMALPWAAVRGAEALGPAPGPADVRRYFEQFFEPVRREPAGPTGSGLLTGYYEPEVAGALAPSVRFCVPIYRRPPDLENVVPERDRASQAAGFSHLRRTPEGLVPYPTRQEIECGALEGRGLELVWLEDWVDAFVLHVQGSGRVRLPDGRILGLSYDGKNGHPYTSIGRALIDDGVLAADGLTMQRLADWLRADVERGRRMLWQNRSFVFFRLRTPDRQGPEGVSNNPLFSGRSLAVDPAHHRLGLPVFLVAPQVEFGGRPVHRLMFAHDVGSAIRGAERGDFFFGAGETAARLAGATKAACTFFPLLPRGAT